MRGAEVFGGGVGMSPHEQRVLTEKEELGEKIVKLSQFIGTSEVFQGLDAEDQTLLREQWAAMLDYHDILEQRIARLPKES